MVTFDSDHHELRIEGITHRSNVKVYGLASPSDSYIQYLWEFIDKGFDPKGDCQYLVFNTDAHRLLAYIQANGSGKSSLLSQVINGFVDILKKPGRQPRDSEPRVTVLANRSFSPDLKYGQLRLQEEAALPGRQLFGVLTPAFSDAAERFSQASYSIELQLEDPVVLNIAWANMDAARFEELLFDLLSGLEGYENVQLTTKTNAPDRGSDISAYRVIHDAGGIARHERTVLQAKHWLRTSIGPRDVYDALASLPLLEPPPIHHLIIATSGRFTADAEGVIRKHNTDGKLPFIEMWPDTHLGRLVSKRPDLIAKYQLRGE